MITIATSTPIFLCLPPTDMRKSFDGLVGVVQQALGEEPLSGSLFVFINKRRDRIKILQWHPDGFELWYKRLEEGTYQDLPPLVDSNGEPLTGLELTSQELSLLLAGIDLKVRRRKRYRRELEANR